MLMVMVFLTPTRGQCILETSRVIVIPPKLLKGKRRIVGKRVMAQEFLRRHKRDLQLYSPGLGQMKHRQAIDVLVSSTSPMWRLVIDHDQLHVVSTEPIKEFPQEHESFAGTRATFRYCRWTFGKWIAGACRTLLSDT